MKKMLALVLMATALCAPMAAHIAFESTTKTVHAEIVTNYAHAEEAAPVVVADQESKNAQDEIKEPTWGDGILKWMSESGAILAGLAMVAEFLFRLFPTKKPLSLLVPAKYAAVTLAAIFTFLGNFLQVLIEKANLTKK